jgi:hypothetical protein
MQSGQNMDIVAKAMLDDPATSEVVYFFHDETMHHLVATVKRSEIAGVIFGPQKSGTFTQRL